MSELNLLNKNGKLTTVYLKSFKNNVKSLKDYKQFVTGVVRVNLTNYEYEDNLSDSAKEILNKRYTLKNRKPIQKSLFENVFEYGDLETYFVPNEFKDEQSDEVFIRVALALCTNFIKYYPDEMIVKKDDIIKTDVENAFMTFKRFHTVMNNLEFLPNSPTLMNAGKKDGQLMACFVVDVPDDLDGIMTAVKDVAMIHKTGGGTGMSFTNLRPKNSKVKTTNGVSSGPVSFMKIFDSTTEQIKQGGTRRGANMGVLNIEHPDIEEFIDIKKDNKTLTNFNLSVGISDKFMKAVDNNSDFDLINPLTNEVDSTVKARYLFDKIIDSAYLSGDPGLLFLDTINRERPIERIKIEATNPCGEQPLEPYNACVLGSINLNKCIVTISNTTHCLSMSKLQNLIITGIDMLDSMIDINHYPLEKIENRVKDLRRIGLGVMGFADLLCKLQIPYNTREARDVGETIMKLITEEGRIYSSGLAKVYGNFPLYNESKFADSGVPMRNAAITTIAPTGTLSMIADCSSGIEPHFALGYVKKVMDDKKFIYTVNNLSEFLKDNVDYDKIEYIKEQITKVGTFNNLSEEDKNLIPKYIRDIFITAQEIDFKDHILMQASLQKYTDTSISKTINMLNSSTREDIEEAYKLAFKTGCKGITIYRDGCKSEQVLYVGNNTDKKEEVSSTKIVEQNTNNVSVMERPDVLNGFTRRIKTGLGTLYLTINEYDGKPIEVFATIGKSGKSTTAKAEAIGRLTSLALRANVSVKDIVKQLEGISGDNSLLAKGGLVMSIPDAISKVLKERYLSDTVCNKNDKTMFSNNGCPECGNSLETIEGCSVCKSCGFSKCG